MINRRKFLQNTGALALGGLALSQSASAFPDGLPMARSVGIQLFTVMSTIDDDLDGTLKKIANIGYREIESAYSKKGGFYGMSAKEFAAKLKGFGLAWKAHHTLGTPFKLPAGAKMPTGADGKPLQFAPLKNLRESYQEIVDGVADSGIAFLVCAATSIETMDEIKKSIETLQKTGEACKKAGIGFAYHNHTKEFEKMDGQTPYDMFLTQISPDLMKMELDLGWATEAGMDPVELFKKNPGRYPLWHVKDINKETRKPVEIGAGYIDFKRVFEASKIAGLQHFFVEQDGAPNPMANIETSFKNLAKIGA